MPCQEDVLDYQHLPVDICRTDLVIAGRKKLSQRSAKDDVM